MSEYAKSQKMALAVSISLKVLAVRTVSQTAETTLNEIMPSFGGFLTKCEQINKVHSKYDNISFHEDPIVGRIVKF